MSDQNNTKEKDPNRRSLGKLRRMVGKFGDIWKIYMDNLSPSNQDGSPNQYYTGSLIWADAITGKNYHVKQVSVNTPKNGMPKSLAEKGYTAYVNLKLDDDYEVTVLS